MKLYWNLPGATLTFWSWLYWDWDSRHHWDGPYILWREHGVRIFGLTIEWLYKEKPYDKW